MEPTAMDAWQILHELTYPEGLPKEALKAASAQRVEMPSPKIASTSRPGSLSKRASGL
jgi:hypothetical protein